MSRDRSPKTFHETDHVSRFNASWKFFRSALAHKFYLKASTCNNDFELPIQVVGQDLHGAG